jgi:hypothetical protein
VFVAGDADFGVEVVLCFALIMGLGVGIFSPFI